MHEYAIFCPNNTEVVVEPTPPAEDAAIQLPLVSAILYKVNAEPAF
jgi:hypothetical protein